MSVVSILEWVVKKRTGKSLVKTEQENGLYQSAQMAKAIISDYIMEKNLTELRVKLIRIKDGVQVRILSSLTSKGAIEDIVVFYGNYRTHPVRSTVVYINSDIDDTCALSGKKSVHSISFIKACQDFVDQYADNKY